MGFLPVSEVSGLTLDYPENTLRLVRTSKLYNGILNAHNQKCPLDAFYYAHSFGCVD